MNAEDWRPSAALETLQRRAAVLQKLRAFFAARGFWEVETPLLSRDTVVDLHLDPLAVPAPSLAIPELSDPNATWYLQTSPEFGMKRLLAAGADRIYQMGRAFRAGERGAEHNPEFTMLEWYHRVDYRAGMDLLADLVHEFWPQSACARVTYREMFQQRLGVDPWTIPLEEVRLLAARRVGGAPQSWAHADREDCLTSLMGAVLQPQLGHPQPQIVCDWPAAQAALARTTPGDDTVAERFELFVAGRELANGYCELTDPQELERRARKNNELRLQRGKRPLPVASRLESAMRHGLPASCGVALGVDRLVMALEGFTRIEDVIAFPIERA